MGKFFERFGRGHKVFLPVIHIDGRVPLESALKNTDIAARVGADGVFLIEHAGRVRAQELLDIQAVVSAEYPGCFAGVNCLTLMNWPWEAFEMAGSGNVVAGIWNDASGFDENGPSEVTARIDRAILETGWSGLHFGSVAFKYQAEIPDDKLAYVARLAKEHMDVLVTSGPGTGKPAEPQRIKFLRSGLGKDFPLVIASGVDIDNIDEYPEADGFMVASSITKSFHELDERKTAVLCSAAHGRA